jgi:hypothetical protein
MVGTFLNEGNDENRKSEYYPLKWYLKRLPMVGTFFNKNNDKSLIIRLLTTNAKTEKVTCTVGTF